LFWYFVGVFIFFLQKISILSRKQTENLKFTLESKIALRVQEK